MVLVEVEGAVAAEGYTQVAVLGDVLYAPESGFLGGFGEGGVTEGGIESSEVEY